MTSARLTFDHAILDETVYLLPDATKLTITANNANELTLIAGNNISTLLIYQPLNGPEMSEEALNSVHKLATAVNLSPNSYLALNLNKIPNLSFRDIKAVESIKTIITFGVTPDMLDIRVDYTEYKSFIFNNLNILISGSLEGISPDDKKRLWHGLQIMYKLK